MNNDMYNHWNNCNRCIDLKDHGPEPYVVNIEDATNQNYNFRLALWTGTHLQLTFRFRPIYSNRRRGRNCINGGQ